jgi:hypothetical protein
MTPMLTPPRSVSTVFAATLPMPCKRPWKKPPVWNPAQVQFLYKHKNGRYYVHAFDGSKEK